MLPFCKRAFAPTQDSNGGSIGEGSLIVRIQPNSSITLENADTFAATKGWIDESKNSVRAHIER
jgi:hypothetical protein